MQNHTSYLSFLLHRQDFRKPNFTPKKTTKGTKNTKNVSEKVKCMHFFHSIWKNLHRHVCGVCDKFEVCMEHKNRPHEILLQLDSFTLRGLMACI